MKDHLPEQFIKGLTCASLQGRAQIVPDQLIKSERSDELVFFLDGAHSPESMEVCARWFSLAIKEYNPDKTLFHQQPDSSKLSHEVVKMRQIGDQRKPTPVDINLKAILKFKYILAEKLAFEVA